VESSSDGEERGKDSGELEGLREEAQEKYSEERGRTDDAEAELESKVYESAEANSHDLEDFRNEAAEKYPEGGDS